MYVFIVSQDEQTDRKDLLVKTTVRGCIVRQFRVVD